MFLEHVRLRLHLGFKSQQHCLSSICKKENPISLNTWFKTKWLRWWLNPGFKKKYLLLCVLTCIFRCKSISNSLFQFSKSSEIKYFRKMIDRNKDPKLITFTHTIYSVSNQFGFQPILSVVSKLLTNSRTSLANHCGWLKSRNCL